MTHLIKRGFTLAEMLIVLAVLGVFAAIAIPKLSGAREEAQAAAMVADLRLAALYQVRHAAQNGGAYFSGTATPESAIEGLRTSPGVTVTLTALREHGSSRRSWIGVARHAGSNKRCEINRGLVRCDTRLDWGIGQLATS